MKRVLLPIIMTLLATISTPLAGIAQSRAESRPDNCGTQLVGEYAGEYVCTFKGAEQGRTIISVFPKSIQWLGSNGPVNFAYMTSNRRVKNQAQVSCHESLDHWHRFLDEYRSEFIDVTTYASHRMLNYVCEKAGHPVGDQIKR